MPEENLLLLLAKWVVGPIIGVGVTKIKDWYNRSQQHQQAMESITRAVTNTVNYLNELEGGAKTSRERELRLSVDWDIAGMDLMNIAETDEERELATKLRKFKSEAWKNPDKWSDGEIKSAGIDISTVREKLAKFIEPSDEN